MKKETDPDPFSGLGPEEESALMAEAETPKIPSIEQILVSCGVAGLVEGSNMDSIVSVLRTLAEQIKDQDRLIRAAIREATIAKLQAIGTRSPAGLVDSAISLYAADALDQNEIRFIEPLPWPEQVDGAELLNDISSAFCRYVVISSNEAAALALWTVLTYLLDAVWTLPLLLITSPVPRCGKTRIMQLLQVCALRPLLASNVSSASLYRVAEKYAPTLLIDEVDTFLPGNDQLRGIINSGHERSAAFVIRCDGESPEARRFSTWCPKVLALIGNVADTLEDRSIHIRMKRKTRGEQVQRLRSDRIGKELEPLRRKAARWAMDGMAGIKNADPEIPSELHDRAQDNWRPLLAIADAAGGTWPAIAREAAVALSGAAGDDEHSTGALLLSDMKSIFKERNVTRVSSQDLTQALGEMIERPWPEFGKSKKPISQRQIARILKQFGIRPRQLWIGEKTRGYKMDDAFLDASSRYAGVFDPVEAVEPNTGAGLSPISEPVGKDKPTG